MYRQASELSVNCHILSHVCCLQQKIPGRRKFVVAEVQLDICSQKNWCGDVYAKFEAQKFDVNVIEVIISVWFLWLAQSFIAFFQFHFENIVSRKFTEIQQAYISYKSKQNPNYKSLILNLLSLTVGFSRTVRKKSRRKTRVENK